MDREMVWKTKEYAVLGIAILGVYIGFKVERCTIFGGSFNNYI